MHSTLPPNFAPKFLRGILMSAIIAITMTEVLVYMQVEEYVKYGALPWYIGDVAIVTVTMVEVILAPPVSWAGYGRRRAALISWLLMPGLAMLLLLPLPQMETPDNNPVCGAEPQESPLGVSILSAVRLLLLLFIGMCSALARQGIWSHGIAYLDEHRPEAINLHYGILVTSRVVGLVVLPNIMNTNLPYWVQTMGITLPLFLNALQMIKLPQLTPEVNPKQLAVHGRGYMQSMARVMQSKTALSYIVIMSLLAASVWGFGWNEKALIRTMYQTVPPIFGGNVVNDILMYHMVIIPIMLIGLKQMSSIRKVFEEGANSAMTFKLNFVVGFIYLVITLALDCNFDPIQGFNGYTYERPNCSEHCSCAYAWSGFSPACVNFVDLPPATFMNPCHAGCQKAEIGAGEYYLLDCACGQYNFTGLDINGSWVGGNGHLHSCTSLRCTGIVTVHQFLYLISVTFAILSFQLQGVMLLQEVDPRDRSVALGLATSVVTVVTFVVGHLAYFFIGVLTCAWSENNICLLQNNTFPTMLGAVSASLTFTSALIGFVLWILLKRRVIIVENDSDNDMIKAKQVLVDST